MRRALTAVSILCVIVLLVAGCTSTGGPQGSPSTSVTPPPAATAPVAATAVPATQPPQQAEAKPIRIAALGPMTHQTGQKIVWNTQMAAEEINATGGVQVGGEKRPIEIVKVDTNELLSVPDAASAVERAITVDKVDFLIGSWRSEAVMAMQDVAMDHKKIFMSEGTLDGLSARVKEDYERYKYWFRVYNSTADVATQLPFSLDVFVKQVRKELGIEKPKVALLLEQTLATEAVGEFMKKMTVDFGAEVVGTWKPSQTATDVSAELLAAKEAGAHIIWHYVYGPAAPVVAKQWGELKIPAALGGLNADVPLPTFMKSTAGLADYSSSTTYVARVAITDKTLPFWDKYVAKTGDWPDVMSQFYGAVYVLKEAIERANSLDADAVVAELEKTDYTGPLGRVVYKGMDTKGPHDPMVGAGYMNAIVVQWQEQELKAIWPPADGSFHGVVYDGVVEPKLPPWMIEYWKDKQ